MKLSVSLSEDDVAMLDRFVEQRGLPSRSAGVQRAISLLHGPSLASEYAEAFEEWEVSDERRLWGGASADGLRDEAW